MTHTNKNYCFVEGSVLANRLTDISNWNVLVVEAGDNENALSDMPLKHGSNGATMDWGYRLEAKDNFSGS